jgi:hypothetical protein
MITNELNLNTNDLNFAYKVRHALNENLDQMPASATDRLAAARKMALSRKKKNSPLRVFAQHSVLAGQRGGAAGGTDSPFHQPLSWLGRMGVAVPLLTLAIGLVSLYQFEQQQRINETADIDSLVLSDELPLTAYLDHGFNAYLAKRGE